MKHIYKPKPYKIKTEHHKYPNGTWSKKTYDQNNNQIYWEDSTGYWVKWEYDNKGNEIYWGNSNKQWGKRIWSENGNNLIYHEENNRIYINIPHGNAKR